MAVLKVQRVYFDYKHYMNPVEVQKAFRLYHKYNDDTDKVTRAETRAELVMLLDVMAAKEEQTYRLSEWQNGDETVAILQILEEVTESMFTSGQDD